MNRYCAGELRKAAPTLDEGACPKRRLAARMMADIAGYSRLVGQDESGTVERMQRLRADVLEPAIAEKSGRLVKSLGDGFLAEFASVVDATACALSRS